MNVHHRFLLARLLGLLVAGTLGLTPRWASAQQVTDVEMSGRVHGVRPPAAYYQYRSSHPGAFEFSPDNGWMRRGQAVARQRNMLRAQLAPGVQAMPLANRAGGVLTGTLRVPVFLALYSNTDSAALVAFAPPDSFTAHLFSTSAAPPYSVHTYYQEISRGNLDYQGIVTPWTRLSQADTYYEGGCSGLCGSAHVAQMIQELVAANDPNVDYGQFDNDGPDAVPNSGDDDGYVDAIVIFHPETDGSCGGSNIWAHSYSYRGWTGTDLQTQDNAFNGGKIKIRDYVIQGGQGGMTGAFTAGCNPGQPAQMGTVTHETGHLFGLPDLYNTGVGSSEGIGNWGLMASGNFLLPNRPVHMSAWSRNQLGWITEVMISRDTTLDLSPIETADTAYVVPISESNEYYLLSNRQQLGSDANIYGGGLLVWQIDSVLARLRGFPAPNTVNASSPEAVRLVQADGRGDLQAGRNRGDSGDPWPGSTSKAQFGPLSAPASTRNNGTQTCVVMGGIQQLSMNGPVRVTVSFSQDLIAASDTLARFKLDGQAMSRFAGCLETRDYSLDMDSPQVVNQGGNRYTWLSWSDGQPRSHTFTASNGADTITAQVKTEYLLKVTTVGSGGSVTSTADTAGDVAAGVFLLKNGTAKVVANVTQPGGVFEGWSGDATGTADTLTLTMIKPYRITATLASALAAPAPSLPGAIMGKSYSQQLAATGGTGTYQWALASGTLPPGVALASNGKLTGVPAAPGDYSFQAKVTSGSQTATIDVAVTVTIPTLALDSVLVQVLGLSSNLSADDLSFLDLAGNKNGRLDVGDFLAWVSLTGQQASAASAMARVQGKLP